MISLKSLAHDILNLESDQDLGTIHKKTKEIYDKLVILEYLTKNIDSLEEETTSDQFEKTQVSHDDVQSEEIEREEIIDEFYEEIKTEDLDRDTNESDEVAPTINIEDNNLHENPEDNEESLEELFEPKFDSIKEDFSLKDEFKDTVSLDDTEKLFETKKTEAKSISLNDKLLGRKIQVGLNDRIAFVNSLFDYNQSDFNRILNELNSFETEIEAKNYIQNSIKTKYNWIGKEDVEERFILLVERKFL